MRSPAATATATGRFTLRTTIGVTAATATTAAAGTKSAVTAIATYAGGISIRIGLISVFDL